jgi:hypothetical protein
MAFLLIPLIWTTVWLPIFMAHSLNAALSGQSYNPDVCGGRLK